MATEISINGLEIVARAADGGDEAVAFNPASNRYHFGDVDGDVFINAGNVKFVGNDPAGERDDARAVSYFSEKFGADLKT